MTGAVTVIEGSGDIVEKQSYLNGTRYFLIEGVASGADAEWTWTLSMTLPKEAGELVAEGDLSMTAGSRSWFADCISGTYAEPNDEATDAPVTGINLQLLRRSEDESTERWRQAECAVVLQLDACNFRVTVRDCGQVTPR